MNTWKQKSRLTQADLTSEPSTNLAREQSPMVRYFQEAAAGEQSHPLELDKQMRSRMERQFGLDFSAVRLVESDLPGKLGADAIAQGDLIRFAPGAFHPETAQGEQLLSHELSHVVRQSQGTPGGEAGLPLYDAALERGADVMAAQAMAGEPAAGPARAFTPVPSAQAPMQGGRTKPGQASQNKRSVLKLSLLDTEPSPFWPTDEDLKNLYLAHSEDGELPGWLENGLLQAEKPKRPDWLFTPEMDNDLGNALKERYYSARTAWENRYQFNPQNNFTLGWYLSSIDRAKTVREAQEAFKKIPGNKNIKGDIGGRNIDQMNLRSVKLRLKGMVRMMYDTPQLQGRIDAFNAVPIADEEIIMAARYTYADSPAEKSSMEIYWSSDPNSYIYGQNEWKNYYDRRKNRREISRRNGWTSSHGRWDGTHELGHVLQYMLSDQLLNSMNGQVAHPTFGKRWVQADLINRSQFTASYVVQQAISELLADQSINIFQRIKLGQFVRKYTDDEMGSEKDNLKLKELKDRSKYLDLLNYTEINQNYNCKDSNIRKILEIREKKYKNMLQDLHKMGLTSQYGSNSVSELFAEAFSDYYGNGENANPLSKKIVEIVKGQTDKKASLAYKQRVWANKERDKFLALIDWIVKPSPAWISYLYKRTPTKKRMALWKQGGIR